MNNTIIVKKIKRPGAGRTKGSFSFVTATRAEMESLNPNSTFRWMVSRKQIEALGGNNFVTERASELAEALAGQSVETTVPVKSEEF